MAAKPMTFEKALEKLEEIVSEIEGGDLPLEKALKRFEEGVNLSRICTKKLDETEKKIHLLLENKEGDLTESPFE